MVWPASLQTLSVVHALATLRRWHEGDKQGVRGLLFPVKTNAFHRLNHLHFDRGSILRIANNLAEVNSNTTVIRSMRDKDPFFFSLTDGSLSPVAGERLNPTIGELLPHFLATPDYVGWKACDSHLLARIRAKLARRAHARALQLNCAVIGDPHTAPDALFALDGRMSEDELRRACRALVRLGPPEVVLVQATRAVRFEARGWKGRFARFCVMLEDVFGAHAPGVVVVTDDPHAANLLKGALWEQNNKRDASRRWRTPHEYQILGIPSTVGAEGLLPPGAREAACPAPREFDVSIVDADAAKVASKLVHIASDAPGGREAAQPLMAAASFLSRLAALPCGARHISEYLGGPDVSDRTRTAFDWPSHMGAVQEFDRSVGVGDDRSALQECLQRGSQLFGNYHQATPFAHKLAALVANVVTGKKRRVAIVFTNALYRRLAERFLSEYDQYPEGAAFESLRERVHLLSAAHLEEHLDKVEGSTLVFAGLNEDCLRLLLTDDRIPAHSALLMTQRAGQFLRATLKPIVAQPEFKPYKPRRNHPAAVERPADDASVCPPAITCYQRSEWSCRLMFRRANTELTLMRGLSGSTRTLLSTAATRQRFSVRPCIAARLRCRIQDVPGPLAGAWDKVFIMSAELREMVEQVLRDAGIPSKQTRHSNRLCGYHEQVQRRLAERFPGVGHRKSAVDSGTDDCTRPACGARASESSGDAALD